MPILSFKERVLQVVSKIPEGKVLTYKQVAEKAGSPRAYRAVGSILRKNWNEAIPCHRVIGSNGQLTGYNRGLPEKKRRLIAEGVKLIALLFLILLPVQSVQAEETLEETRPIELTSPLPEIEAIVLECMELESSKSVKKEIVDFQIGEEVNLEWELLFKDDQLRVAELHFVPQNLQWEEHTWYCFRSSGSLALLKHDVLGEGEAFSEEWFYDPYGVLKEMKSEQEGDNPLYVLPELTPKVFLNESSVKEIFPSGRYTSKHL